LRRVGIWKGTWKLDRDEWKGDREEGLNGGKNV